MYCAGMDNSNESAAHMLGLNVVDDQGCQNISFEDGSSLGTKRLHLDSESSIDNEVNINSIDGYIIGKRIKLENTSEDEGTSGLIQGSSCDELGDESGMMLGSAAQESMTSSTEDMVFSTADSPMDESVVLIHHMDIREPLTNLKKAMEEVHGINLDGYEFYLQDSTLDYVLHSCMCPVYSFPEDKPVHHANISCNADNDLDPFITCPVHSFPEDMPVHHANISCNLLAGHKNLVEQCVQGCGTVQVNLALKTEDDGTKKINILDVLKPSDSYLLATGNPAFSPDMPEDSNQATPVEEESSAPDKNLIRWVVDHNFKVNQQKLQIPQDPMEWDVPHVRHWLLWAVRQFNLTGIKLADWKISGATLCNLSLDDFKARVPYDPGDIFWTHLELLRRCKFVAVMQNPEELVLQENVEQKSKENELDKNIMRTKEKKAKASVKSLLPSDTSVELIQHVSWGNRTGNNGQVQLWQFLLDLLTDKEHRECIQWLGSEGEFKLIEPERVARLWGMRKNKPSMNYEKLSRALRYYYDGDMIAKVHGKRFVYKFVCDLKQLLGYSAFELNRLVIEAEMRAMNSASDPLQHSIFGHRGLT